MRTKPPGLEPFAIGKQGVICLAVASCRCTWHPVAAFGAVTLLCALPIRASKQTMRDLLRSKAQLPGLFSPTLPVVVDSCVESNRCAGTMPRFRRIYWESTRFMRTSGGRKRLRHCDVACMLQELNIENQAPLIPTSPPTNLLVLNIESEISTNGWL